MPGGEVKALLSAVPESVRIIFWLNSFEAFGTLQIRFGVTVSSVTRLGCLIYQLPPPLRATAPIEFAQAKFFERTKRPAV